VGEQNGAMGFDETAKGMLVSSARRVQQPAFLP
jgi:hypothetical protein